MFLIHCFAETTCIRFFCILYIMALHLGYWDNICYICWQILLHSHLSVTVQFCHVMNTHGFFKKWMFKFTHDETLNSFSEGQSKTMMFLGDCFKLNPFESQHIILANLPYIKQSVIFYEAQLARTNSTMRDANIGQRQGF